MKLNLLVVIGVLYLAKFNEVIINSIGGWAFKIC